MAKPQTQQPGQQAVYQINGEACTTLSIIQTIQGRLDEAVNPPLIRPAHPPATNSGLTLTASEANSWPPKAAWPSEPASRDSLQSSVGIRAVNAVCGLLHAVQQRGAQEHRVSRHPAAVSPQPSNCREPSNISMSQLKTSSKAAHYAALESRDQKWKSFRKKTAHLKLFTSSSTPPMPCALSAAPTSMRGKDAAAPHNGPAADTAARVVRSGTEDLMRVIAPKLLGGAGTRDRLWARRRAGAAQVCKQHF